MMQLKLLALLQVLALALPATGLFLGSVAQAEDDLMSILEGKTETSSSQFVEGEELQKLKLVVNPSSAEQNIFFQFMAEKNYEKALFQWRSAYEGSSFEQSANGKALDGFLLFKNGLKITGVGALFSISYPEQIDNSIMSLWKESLSDKDPVWKTVQLKWTPYWTTIFGVGAEMTVALQKNYVNEDIATLTDLIKKTPVDSRDRAVLQWQLVLNLGIQGDAAKAAKVLAHLLKVKNNPIDQDLMTLTAGRLLYQNGFLDAAIKYYKEISKKSDYWFVAQEEIAWAYMRKGEPQNALAVTKTLTYPNFKGWVGMESYLLSSFVDLKVCNYSGILGTMKSLKPQFGEHLIAVEKLSQDPNQSDVQKLLKRIQSGPVSISDLGQSAHRLPWNISRDESLVLLMKRHKALMDEADLAEKLFARSLSFGQLQGQFDILKSQIRNQAQMSEASALLRVQEVAKHELEDSKQIMQRLRIVEVEMIQQVDAADKLLKKAGPAVARRGQTGAQSKYAMSFANDKELWFDELSNYRVDVKKGCSKDTIKESL